MSEELGIRLKNLRERAHLTQKDVADYLDVGYSSYRRYEEKSILPKSRELMKLADLYDVTVDELLGIGAIVVLEYDKARIDKLRQALKMTDSGEKLAIIEEVLPGLLARRDMAFTPPNITVEDVGIYVGRNIRTIRFNKKDDDLVLFAMMEKTRLENTKGDRYMASEDIGFPPLTGYEDMDLIRKAVQFNMGNRLGEILPRLTEGLSESTKQRIKNSGIGADVLAGIIENVLDEIHNDNEMDDVMRRKLSGMGK